MAYNLQKFSNFMPLFGVSRKKLCGTEQKLKGFKNHETSAQKLSLMSNIQEAKDYIDKQDKENSINNILGEDSSERLSKEDLDAKSRELLAADRKVAAIKFMHIATGMSLKEAHEYINSLQF